MLEIILTSILFFQRIRAGRDISFSFSNRCLCLLTIISIVRRINPTNIPPTTSKNTPIKNIHNLSFE